MLSSFVSFEMKHTVQVWMISNAMLRLDLVVKFGIRQVLSEKDLIFCIICIIKYAWHWWHFLQWKKDIQNQQNQMGSWFYTFWWKLECSRTNSLWVMNFFYFFLFSGKMSFKTTKQIRTVAEGQSKMRGLTRTTAIVATTIAATSTLAATTTPAAAGA